MKKIFLLCFSAILLCATAKGQAIVGIQFFEGTFDKAMEQAIKEKKMVFMDAYATWCGPCKRMASNVFTNKEVGDYFNANFVNIKVNWETPEGDKLQSKYPINAYPTMMIIDATGKRVGVIRGYREPSELIKEAQEILKNVNKK